VKRTAIISTSAHKEYCFWLPICEAFWRRAGYEVFAFIVGDGAHLDYALASYSGKHYHIGLVEGVRPETVSQVSRLFGHLHNQGYLLTADVDMLTLDASYFGNTTHIDVYGHDLTGHAQYPICYIGMDASTWAEIMPAKTVEQGIYDLCCHAYASKNKSADFYDWWDIDQQAITDRLSTQQVRHIERGRDPVHGMAQGRWDRADWREPYGRIDAHMPRNNWEQSRILVDQYFDFNNYAHGFAAIEG
jgi:hypothetical protein